MAESSARTRPAPQAMEARLRALADGDPQRAEHLRRSHELRLAWRSARVRSAPRD